MRKFRSRFGELDRTQQAFNKAGEGFPSVSSMNQRQYLQPKMQGLLSQTEQLGQRTGRVVGQDINNKFTYQRKNAKRGNIVFDSRGAYIGRR